MESDEKTCPRCAETIKAAATMCRFCNYDFTAQPASPAPAPARAPARADAPPAPKKKAGCWIVAIIIIVGLLVLGIASQSGSPPNQQNSDNDSSSADKQPRPIQISAVELAQAYESNEVAAQNKFGGHTLDVTGTVAAVRLGIMDTPTLHLVATNEFMPVQATFDEASKDTLSKLSKGQQVTIRCTSITNVISTPMLSDCSFP